MTIYALPWVLIVVLMGAVAFKKYKKYKVKSRRRSFKLVEGDNIGKVCCGHKRNND